MSTAIRLMLVVTLGLFACDKAKPADQAAGSAEATKEDEGKADKAKASAELKAPAPSAESAAARATPGGIAAGLEELATAKPGAAPVAAATGGSAAVPTPPPPAPESPTPEPTPTPAGGAAPAPPAPIAATDSALKVGDRVMARWTNGSWYPGKIAAITPQGTYDVNYDDGDKSRGLPAAKVRKQTASKSSGRSSGGGAKASTPGNCPGPGITRRCNGVCVNIQEDSNHCGGCNNRCPSGKTCDGHLFCRDAAGNL